MEDQNKTEIVLPDDEMKHKQHKLVLKINNDTDSTTGIVKNHKTKNSDNEDSRSDNSGTTSESPPIDDIESTGTKKLTSSSHSKISKSGDVSPESQKFTAAQKSKLRGTKSVDAGRYNKNEDNESTNSSSDSGEFSKPRVRHTKSMDSGTGSVGGFKNRVPKAVVPPFLDAEKNGQLNTMMQMDSMDSVNLDKEKKQIQPENFTFDPNDEIYLANACCECMHYRTSAVVVALFEIALIIAWTVLISYYYSHVDIFTSRDTWAISCQSVLGAVILASIISMLAGVVLENHMFLYPYMAIQLLAIGSLLVLTFLAVVVMAVGSDLSEKVFGFIFGHENLPKIEQNFGPIWPFCLAVVFDFGAAVGIWFYVLIKGYYDYLQDKLFFSKIMAKKGGIKNGHMASPVQKSIGGHSKSHAN